MEIILFLSILLSFFITFLFLKPWIAKAKRIGMVWENMNKYGFPKSFAGSGGLIVVMGFVLGTLSYIAIKTFYLKTPDNIVELFALLSSILILAVIGIVDDLLGWHHGGLSKSFRLFLCIFAAVPLMVINAGQSSLDLPLIGMVNFGILYPLILIPLGIVATSTTFNMLAGFNGLEAGLGVIILSALSGVAYITGNSWIALIGLIMIAALLAFLIYNKYPAVILPGDSLTYPVGGLIAIMAILGNFEKIAIFFFIPCIIEVILKLRGGLKMQSFGKPNIDGTLDLKYEGIYSLNHLAILLLKKLHIKSTEKNAVYLLWGFQIIIILAGFFIFRDGIFG